MSRGNEKWLLVQWEEGGVAVVHVRSLVHTNHEELQPGGAMKAYVKGELKAGTFICKSHDHQLLDQMQQKMKAEAEGGPSAEAEQEPADFSASASSWEPSEDQASESDEGDEKKIKLENSRKEHSFERPRKRILTPSHRANAVIPESMQRGNISTNNSAHRKRTYKSIKQKEQNQKSWPDSTKKNMQCEVTLQNVTVDLNDIIEIRDCFKHLFQIVQEMKSLGAPESRKVPITPDLTNTMTNMSAASDDEKENNRSRSLESDRSEDNILISNKYEQYNGNNHSGKSPQQTANPPTANKEWIPIGSGKTLLHKDKFRKVNWKSYTIATRTLLLALFPRRILATHSLTGKRSPAFQNKPAKMCLDPKIISDVIIEIQDRFRVKENLIRSIITTKCADECKMYKMRQAKRKTTASVETKERENVDEDKNNRTA